MVSKKSTNRITLSNKMISSGIRKNSLNIHPPKYHEDLFNMVPQSEACVMSFLHDIFEDQNEPLPFVIETREKKESNDEHFDLNTSFNPLDLLNNDPTENHSSYSPSSPQEEEEVYNHHLGLLTPPDSPPKLEIDVKNNEILFPPSFSVQDMTSFATPSLPNYTLSEEEIYLVQVRRLLHVENLFSYLDHKGGYGIIHYACQNGFLQVLELIKQVNLI